MDSALAALNHLYRLYLLCTITFFDYIVLQKYIINVNAIAPGYMATDNTAALRADEQRNAEILGRILAGHWGDPDDLSGAVVFLASDAARYIQGISLPVDGGWHANEMRTSVKQTMPIARN